MATQVRDLSTHCFKGRVKGGPKEDLEDGFERVVEISNEAAGLSAYVALHSTVLGPALGGCRFFNYQSREAAVTDVCNLARGMSYKNALAGIPFGGGKACIVGAPERKTPQLLEAFAEGLNLLNGDYLTAEDSGITPADMAMVGKFSPFVAGADAASGGGNPAPYTARGVFLGLKAAVTARLGCASLSGVTVGIEGLGQVGFALAQLLHREGARVRASELNPERLDQAVQELGVVAVAGKDLPSSDLDVFAPCAMGGAINTARISKLRAPVIAGAANNQLENAALGDLLARRGQLYAPDYVINAAGVISIAGEYMGCWSPEWVSEKVQQIPLKLQAIFERAEHARLPTSLIADRCAREAIRTARGSQLSKSA